MDAREINLDIPGIKVGDIVPLYNVYLYCGGWYGGTNLVDEYFSTSEEALDAYDNFEERYITDEIQNEIYEWEEEPEFEIILQLDRTFIQYIGNGMYDTDIDDSLHSNFVDSLGSRPSRWRTI